MKLGGHIGSARRSTSVSRRAADRGVGRGLLLAGVVAGVVSVPALAGPRGESVAAGSATFQRSGAHTTITTSHTAIIDYSSFNLGAAESVTFVQPNASSRVLNRIESAMPTMIDGSVTANGAVYFSNPAGVIFGPNSVLNVGDLFAAAGRISNEDFLAGRNRFTDLSGEVVNYGTIRAQGDVSLLGQRVANFGTLVAPEGMITLAAADGVLIGRRGGYVFAKVTNETMAAGGSDGSAGVRAPGSVENHGTIEGGVVRLGAGDHFALAVGGSSVISGGEVLVEGGVGSRVEVSGRIEARAGGDGGVVEVTGGAVALSGAEIDASGATGGEVRIGGDVQGRGAMRTAQATIVDASSTIDVSSTGAGDAGTAVVWSDGRTVFEGSIDATARTGDGGFVEVSGKGWLGFDGDVSTLSLGGADGVLLLDPKNILITNAGGIESEVTSLTDVDDFLDASLLGGADGASLVDDALTSNLTDAQIETLLGQGDVVLLAENDILFGGTGAIEITSGTINSLELRALRSVTDVLMDGVGTVTIDLGGDFIARANYVPGADEIARVTQRDAGDAVISLGNTTVSSRSAAFVIGAGHDGSQAGGDILLPDVTASGIVFAQTLATRSETGATGSIGGGSVVAPSGSAVFEVGGGLGGSIGTSAEPVSIDAGSISLEAPFVSETARGGVFVRIDGVGNGIVTADDQALVDAGLVGFSLTGGSVLGLDAGTGVAPVDGEGAVPSVVEISSPNSIVAGTGTGPALNIDAGELALIAADSVSFDSDVNLTLRDDDSSVNVFSVFAGRDLSLAGEVVAIESDRSAGGDGTPSGSALGVRSLTVTARSDLDLSAVDLIDIGAEGVDLRFELPGSFGLLDGAGDDVFDRAGLLTQFGGSGDFGSLTVVAVGAVDVSVIDPTNLLDGSDLSFTGSRVSVAIGDPDDMNVGAPAVTVVPDGLELIATDSFADAVTLDIRDNSTLGDASMALAIGVDGAALVGNQTGAMGESLQLDGEWLIAGNDGATTLSFGSLAVTASGGVSLVEGVPHDDLVSPDFEFFGAFAGDGLSLSGETVSIVGASAGSVLAVSDLTLVGSTSVSAPVDLSSLGDGTGSVSITTAESIGLLDGAGDLTFAGTDLAAWDFGGWSFESTGAGVDLTDDAGGGGFEAFIGAPLALTGTTVTLGTAGSVLSVSGLRVSASESTGSISLAGFDDATLDVGAMGTVAFETAESVSVGSGAGGFVLSTDLIDQWTFGRLDVESTAGDVAFTNAAGSTASSLFGGGGALDGKDIRAVASGAVSFTSSDLVTGGSPDAIDFASAELRGSTVSFTGVGDVDLGNGFVIEGAVSFAGPSVVSLLGQGTVSSGDGGLAGIGVESDLDIGGTLVGLAGSGLVFDIDPDRVLTVSGSIDGAGGSIRFTSSGDLVVGGAAASGEAEVSASAVAGLTGFAALAFDGASLAVSGDDSFYQSLTANGLADGPGLSFVADGAIGFALTSGTATLGFDAGGMARADGVLVDAGGRLGDGMTFAALTFGSGIEGVGSAGAGNVLVGDAISAGSVFAVGEGAGSSTSIVLGSGDLAADGGNGDLSLGNARVAQLGGTFAIRADMLQVDAGLSSLFAPGDAAAGLSLSIGDIVLDAVGSGTLAAGGLLVIDAGAGRSIGIGTSGTTDVELTAGEFGGVSFGGLELMGESVAIANDSMDSVFGAFAGADLMVTTGSGDLVISDAGGSGGLSVGAFTYATGSGDFAFAGDVTSFSAVTSVIPATTLDLSLLNGATPVLTLDFGDSDFGASAVSLPGGTLTLGGTLNATAASLQVTAGSVVLDADIDFAAVANEGADLTFAADSFVTAGDPSITGVGRLLFTSAGTPGVFVGDLTGVMSGIRLSTADLTNITIDATPDAGDGVVIESGGAFTFSAEAGLPAQIAKFVELGAAGGANAAQLVWDAGTFDAVVGADPGSDSTNQTFVLGESLFAISRFNAYRLQSDGEVRIGETAVPSVVSRLDGVLTVGGSTNLSATRTIIDVRGADVFLGEASGAGLNIGTASIGASAFGSIEVLTNGDVTVGFDGADVVQGGLPSLRVAGSGLLNTGGVAGVYTLNAGDANVVLGDDLGDLNDFVVDSDALEASSFTTLGLTTTGTVTLGESDAGGLLAGLVSDGLTVTSGGLRIDARTSGIGVGGGDSDIDFGSSFFDNVSGAITLLTDGALVLGDGGTNFGYLANGLTTGASTLEGSGAVGVGSVVFSGGSGVLTLDSIDLLSAGSITFDGGLTGLTSTNASSLVAGGTGITHDGDFTYTGDFEFTGNINAASNALTFREGTFTLNQAGDGLVIVTAGTLTIEDTVDNSSATLFQAGVDDSLLFTLSGDLVLNDLGGGDVGGDDALRVTTLTAGERLTIGDASGGGVRLGDLTGSTASVGLSGAELGRLDLGGRELSVLTAGEVRVVEDLSGSVQSFFDSPGLSLFIGADGTAAGGVVFDTLAASTGFAVSALDVWSAGEVRFASGVTGLETTGMGSSAIRTDFETTGSVVSIENSGFAFSGDLDIVGGLIAADTLTFEDGSFRLIADGALDSFGLDASTLVIRTTGPGSTSVGSPDDLRIALSSQLAISDASSTLGVDSGGTLRLTSTASGISFGNVTSPAGLVVSASEVEQLRLMGASLELVSAGGVFIGDAEIGSTGADLLDTLFGQLAALSVSSTNGGITFTDAGVAGGLVLAPATLSANTAITFGTDVDAVTFGDGTSLVVGTELRFVAPSTTLTMGSSLTLAGGSEVVIAANGLALGSGDLSVTDADLRFDIAGGFTASAANPRVTVTNGDLAFVLTGSSTFNVDATANGFFVVEDDGSGPEVGGTLTFDTGLRSLGLVDATGDVTIEAAGLARFSVSDLSVIAQGGLFIEGSPGQLNPLFDGDIGGGDSIGSITNFNGVVGGAMQPLSLTVGAASLVFGESGADVNTVYVPGLTGLSSAMFSASADNGIRFANGVTSVAGTLVFGTDGVVGFDSASVSLGFGVGSQVSASGLTFAGAATVSGPVAIVGGGDFRIDADGLLAFGSGAMVASDSVLSPLNLTVAASDVSFATNTATPALSMDGGTLAFEASGALTFGGTATGFDIEADEIALLEFGSLALRSDSSVDITLAGSDALGVSGFLSLVIGGVTQADTELLSIDAGGAGLVFGPTGFTFDGTPTTYRVSDTNVSATALSFLSDVGVAITGGSFANVSVGASDTDEGDATPLFAIDAGAGEIGIGPVEVLFSDVNFDDAIVLAELGSVNADVIGLFSDAGVYFAENDAGTLLGEISGTSFDFGSSGNAGNLLTLGIDSRATGILIGADSPAVGSDTFFVLRADDIAGFGGVGSRLDLRSDLGVIISNSDDENIRPVFDGVGLTVAASGGADATPFVIIDAGPADLFFGDVPPLDNPANGRLEFTAAGLADLNTDAFTLLSDGLVTIADNALGSLAGVFETTALSIGSDGDAVGSLAVTTGAIAGAFSAETLSLFIDGTATFGVNILGLATTMDGGGGITLGGGTLRFNNLGTTEIASDAESTTLDAVAFETMGGLEFLDAVALIGGADSSILASGNVRFASTVDSVDAVGVNVTVVDPMGPGFAVLFDDAVGSVDALGDIEIDGAMSVDIGSTVVAESFQFLGTDSSSFSATSDLSLTGTGEGGFGFEFVGGMVTFADGVSITDAGGGQRYSASTFSTGGDLSLFATGPLIIDMRAPGDAFQATNLTLSGSSVALTGVPGSQLLATGAVLVSGPFTLGANINASNVAFNNGVTVSEAAVSVTTGELGALVGPIALDNGVLTLAGEGTATLGDVTSTGITALLVNKPAGDVVFLGSTFEAGVLSFSASGYTVGGGFGETMTFGGAATTEITFSGGTFALNEGSTTLNAGAGSVTLTSLLTGGGGEGTSLFVEAANQVTTDAVGTADASFALLSVLSPTGTTTFGGTLFATEIVVDANAADFASIGAAGSSSTLVTLRADTLELNGPINAATVSIDTLSEDRTISLGVELADSLSLVQGEINGSLNSSGAPIGSLLIGTGVNGGIAIDSTVFDATSIRIGNGSTGIVVAGVSGASGTAGANGSLTFDGTVTLTGPGVSVVSDGRRLEFVQELSLNGDASLASAGGDIVLGGTDEDDASLTDDVTALLAGASLTIDAGEGTVFLPGVGTSGESVALLSVTGAEVRFGGLVNAVAQTYTATDYTVDAAEGLTLLSAGEGSSIAFDPSGLITTGGTALLVGTTEAPITGSVAMAPIAGEVGTSLQVFAQGDVSLAAIGADAPVDSVAVSAGSLVLADVNTAAGQSYTASAGVSLAGNLIDVGATGISFSAPLTVAGDSTITGAPGGTVLFDQLVTLDANLTVNAETTSLLAGLVGNTNTLAVDGGALLVTDTLAAGTFEIGSTLTLQGDTVLDATTGPGVITLADVLGTGVETLTLLAGNDTATGSASLGSVIQLAALRLQVDRLIGAPTEASVEAFVLLPFTDGTDISVGDDVDGTLNISQEFLDSISLDASPTVPGQSPVAIGEAGFGGQIIVGNAVFKAPTTLLTDGQVLGNGFTVFGGTTVTFSGLGGNVFAGNVGPATAVPGAFTLTASTPSLIDGTVSFSSGGGSLIFAGGLNAAPGASALSIDLGGGVLSVEGVLGGESPLGSFSLTSSGLLELPSVLTTGQQTYAGPTIALNDTTLDAQSGGIEFDGVLSLTGTNTVTASNAVDFGADVLVGGSTTVDTVGALTLAGTLNGDGELRLAGSTLGFGVDVAGFGGSLISTAPVLIDSDRDITAGRLELLGGLQTTAGARPIVGLTASGRLAVVGGAGDSLDRFGKITFTGSEVLLGGSFFAQDGFDVNGPAFIVGDETLLRSFELSADASIRFLSTIDTAAVADGGLATGATLTLYVNREDAPEVSLESFSGLLPRIELFDDVGSVRALDTLNLNFTGLTFASGIEQGTDELLVREFVPIETSIVLGDITAFDENAQLSDITINVGSFNMGDREKLIAIGSLTLNATAESTARLGDVTSLGDLVVNSPNVILVARESGNVFDPTANIFTADLGTDYVSDGTVQFGTVSQIVNLVPTAQRPQFANPGGTAAITSSVGGFTVFALIDDLAGLAVSQGQAGLAIDVRAQGATNTNIATVLAGATPRNDDEADIESGTEIDAAVLAQLQELGINARPAGDAGARVGLLNVNLSERPGEQPAVSADRLQSDVVTLVLDAYRDLFVEDQDGTPVNRQNEIERGLEAAVDAYFEENPARDELDFNEFTAFMAESNEQAVAEARVLIAELQDLQQLLRLLGLTERELQGPKNAIFGGVRPRDISRSDWDAIIEGQALRLGDTADATPPADPVEEAISRRPATPPHRVQLGAFDAAAGSLWIARLGRDEPSSPFGG